MHTANVTTNAKTQAAQAAKLTKALASNDAPQKAESAAPKPVASTVVHISNAGQAAATAAAAAEASETPAQTAQEAQGGDRQAQRLLARQSAAAQPTLTRPKAA